MYGGKMKVVAMILFPILLFGQTINQKSDFKEKVDLAYKNAMKGVYYALENIPERKNSTTKDLIANNEIISTVKISKSVGGVSVQSNGFFNTYKVTVEIYRDYASLKSEGVIDYIPKE
jgi:hypothetical protein